MVSAVLEGNFCKHSKTPSRKWLVNCCASKPPSKFVQISQRKIVWYEKFSTKKIQATLLIASLAVKASEIRKYKIGWPKLEETWIAVTYIPEKNQVNPALFLFKPPEFIKRS